MHPETVMLAIAHPAQTGPRLDSNRLLQSVLYDAVDTDGGVLVTRVCADEVGELATALGARLSRVCNATRRAFLSRVEVDA